MKTDLHQTSPLRWLLSLAVDYAGLALTLAGIHYLACLGGLGWLAVWPFGVLAVGMWQHRIGILGHDGAHGLGVGRMAFGGFMTGLFCLWPMGMTLSGYRRFHFYHHKAVGTILDPEKKHVWHPTLGEWEVPAKPKILAWRLAGDLLGGGLKHLAMAARLTEPNETVAMMAPFLTMTFAAITLAAYGLWWVPALWFASLPTGFWFWFRLRIWTEHITHGTQTDQGPTSRLAWPWWMWPLREAICPHNSWCHYEHHHDPHVPCHRLPELRRAMTTGHPIPITVVEFCKHQTQA